MFYVDLDQQDTHQDTVSLEPNGTGDVASPLKAPALLLKTANLSNVSNKSATLMSNCTLDDYNTPPESPGGGDESEEDAPDTGLIAPVPPPRPKRDKKVALKGISPEPSQLLEAAAEDLMRISDDLQDLSEIRTQSITSKVKRNDNELKGYLHIVTLAFKGHRQSTKTRWFVCDKKQGILRYYKSEKDEQGGGNFLGEINISGATFSYEVESDVNGEFRVCTTSGDHLLSAGTAEKRMYWLQQLQKARREFSVSGGLTTHSSKVGLLSSPQDESQGLIYGRGELGEENGEDVDEEFSQKDMSPFKDIMPSLERPVDMHTSPSTSADYYASKKASFFTRGLGLISNVNKPNFRIPRSSSMRTPSPPASWPRGAVQRGVSPPPTVKQTGNSPGSGSFQALSKLRKSLREKKSLSSSGLLTSSSLTSPSKGGVKSFGHGTASSCFGASREEVSSQEDELQALRDEARASKEAIGVLKVQVEELKKEKETLTELQKVDFDDGQLLEILRGKDNQIVALEGQTVELTKICDTKSQEIGKLKDEINTYRDYLEVKDESLVRLTNQLHETELSNIMLAATVTNLSNQNHGGAVQVGSGTSAAHGQLPSTPSGLPPKHPGLVRLHSNSNGISFDSDKGEFKEFVDVGSQTNEGSHQSGAEILVRSTRLRSYSGSGNSSIDERDVERLQDMVTAYEMQNKFLNKELLELNQLKQQAIEREQKIFHVSQDWEAKFYQIQSKYLLLLNELHNPQVGVSASRKEMVSQLLKDIVDADGKKPSLLTDSASYDRFGFRLNDIDNESTTSLEEKAEKLWKQAQEHQQKATEIVETRESLWETAINAFNSRASLPLTTENKNLLRHGIPIAQRGLVWKGIVDHKLMRGNNEKFQADYYKKLLANYNPTRNLTPAAKQIELDLLRTLPNNKHYDRPYADGIAKLRRVLLAYSLHNPDVEYCQGFNRIAAIALLFMNEEDAFWTLVYIVEHLMPPEYYSRDKQLIGAQVDQEVLKEVLQEKLPKLSNHLNEHGIDPSLFTLNWFLCVFVDTLPVKTYLRIWDAFLFEGNKVLFRYAIAIFKYMEPELLNQNDYMAIVNTLRDRLESCYDIETLTQIAFRDLNPFPMRTISHKRDHYMRILEAKKKELDHIRQNYRKTSLARSGVTSVNSNPSVGGAVNHDEDDDD